MIGRTISHYRILEKLGEGGMGMVYKAEDTKLKRTVALKFLSSNYLGTTEEKTRFIREAQSAASLDHPNICTVYEIDEAEGQLFISMAYIEGVILRDKIQAELLEPEEIIDIAIAVAQGLQAAHEKGVIHRDIKSANIMVTDMRQVKITDFGLAKLYGTTKVTKTGMTVGTVAYMSPEQARGESVDHRTDVWSLGVVIYEMLTRQLPFKGEYDQAVIYNIVNQDPDPVTALRSGIPKELEVIVYKCLAKEPSDRYQRTSELTADLLAAKQSLPVESGVNQADSLRNGDFAVQHQSHAAIGGSQDSIPGYKIIRKLSEGGQGVVYQAVQESTRRKVAIKMMREGAFASRSIKARFEREVRVLARLKHPNIVTIHDSGTAAGGLYFVMDYIVGRPLDEYMRSPDAPKSIKDTLNLFESICQAVNAAHLAGIIHRDLKPSNIRIDSEGKPYILDFGLAKMSLGDSEASMMTMTGQFLGSLQWASPEQAAGMPGKIDMRTDVYSLGVVLYQMLTGEFPYLVTGSMHEVLIQIMQTEPRKASTLRREVNDEVDTIVLKCLNKDRERRYQSAGELARDIKHYLTGQPIEAKRDSFGYLMRKQLVRHKGSVVVGVGFAVVIVAALVVSLAFWRRAVIERENAQFRLETARAEVSKSYEEYKAILPRLRRAEDLAALLPEADQLRYPEGSPKVSYLEASKWITDLFPTTPDSVPVSGYATLNTSTRDAVISYARSAEGSRDPVAVAWIQANREGIERLIAATKEHRFNFGTSPGGGLLAQNLLPSLQDVRFGVEILTAGALIDHDEGDHDGVLEKLAAAMRMSRYVGDGGTLINLLVEISCRNAIHNAYRWMAYDAVLKGQLPSIYAKFLQQAPPLPDYKLAYVTEVRALRQMLNEAYVKRSSRTAARFDLARLQNLADLWGDEKNPYADPSPAMIADAKTLEYEVAIAIVTEMCDRLRTSANKSFREIKDEGDRVYKQIEENHPVLMPLVPNFTYALVVRREAQMNWDATVIAAAILSWRSSIGKWPNSIDEALSSFDLKPFCRDYYGSDFVYRIVDDAPLLYTVGPNGIDDGGQGSRFKSRNDAGVIGDDVLFLSPSKK